MSNNLPLKTIGELCKITSIPYGYFQEVLSLKKDPYRRFYINKHNSTSKRRICVPDPNLLKIQKCIKRYILEGFDVHPVATAYINGSSPYLNAAYHCEAGTLIKIDIENFFHSFNERDIYKLFNELGYEKLLSFQLARLCIKVNMEEMREIRDLVKGEDHLYPKVPCESSYLPQGAPTSPILTNLLMINIDNKIDNIVKKYNCKYTRYSDDIVISSKVKMLKSDSTKLLHLIEKALSNKFTLNRKKIKIVNKGQRMIVTGLLVNNKYPQLIKEYKNNLRLQIHYISLYGYTEQAKKLNYDPISYFNHIQGKLIWANSIEPEFAKKLYDKIKGVPSLYI